MRARHVSTVNACGVLLCVVIASGGVASIHGARAEKFSLQPQAVLRTSALERWLGAVCPAALRLRGGQVSGDFAGDISYDSGEMCV
jgi:hypothetical protein